MTTDNQMLLDIKASENRIIQLIAMFEKSGSFTRGGWKMS